MELLADGLLFAAAVGAAIYCQVLAGRLRRLTALESGMGGAIAVLSAQVDDMTRALKGAQGAASGAEQRLAGASGRAEQLARRLELMAAALHDLPPAPEQPPPVSGEAAPGRAAKVPDTAPPARRTVRRRGVRSPEESTA